MLAGLFTWVGRGSVSKIVYLGRKREGWQDCLAGFAGFSLPVVVEIHLAPRGSSTAAAVQIPEGISGNYQQLKK